MHFLSWGTGQTDRRTDTSFANAPTFVVVFIIIIIIIIEFLFQRLTMALQRGNAVSFQNTRRRGVVVTALVESTKLLYVGPG